jgi:hypothetical protein
MKESVEQEKQVFILTTSAIIEAFKNNEAKAKELLRNGGAVVRQRALETINRLRDWIADVEK